MTMSLKEFDRLKKFMAMTDSPVDAEAVAALRQARKLLTAHSYDWAAVLNRLVRLDAEAADPEDVPERDEPPARGDFDAAVDRLFEDVARADANSDFVDSLKEQWDRRRWLSPKQVKALRENVQRLRTDGRI